MKTLLRVEILKSDQPDPFVAGHDKDNCTICKNIESAIVDPELLTHLKEWSELNETAPFGYCSECGLAITESEMHVWGDMHDNCARSRYE